MAPVTRPRDRGQLILVAGLTVAVILVMLVLLLNTVIYTENLATRGIDSEASDVVEYRATVVGSVEELIEHENERYDAGYPPSLGVERGIDEINEFLGERYLYRGVITEVQYDPEEDINKGAAVVWQDDPGAFASGTIMTNATDIEQFVLSVEPDNLTTGGDPFLVFVGDWFMKINVVEIEVASENGENETEERIEVTVEGEEESPYRYGHEDMPLEIDLVGDHIEINGEETGMASVAASEDVIRYENGDLISGTFELHAVGVPNDNTLTLYEGGFGEDPYYTYTIESVDLMIHYETSRVRFVTEETITPVEEKP